MVRNHEFYIKLHLIAQTGTFRAGTEGIVKGKTPGLYLTDTDAAVRAGKTLAESHRTSSHHIHHQKPLCQTQHIFYGICQPALYSLLHGQTVHHNLYIMFYILIQGNFFRQFIQTAINPHTHITAFSGAVQHFCVFSLPSPYHRSQQLQSGSLRQFHNLVHHLVHSLFRNFPAAFGTVWYPDSGIEQTEIVIYLRHGSHRGTGIPVCGLLVYGDGRGQPLNLFHIGFFHLPQEHPGIGGQRLHIAALPFRVNRVKSQG